MRLAFFERHMSEMTDMILSELKMLITQLSAAARSLHAQGLLAGADGNFSARLKSKRKGQSDQVLMTHSGISKSQLKPSDFSVLSLSGEYLSTPFAVRKKGILNPKPSSEAEMHLSVYRAEKRANFVFHAHPPSAIAWSIANPRAQELPSSAFSEVIIAAGRIPVVPFARPGTKEMGQKLEPFLSDHKLMILSRHGALAWGETIDEPLNGMERLEHSSKILIMAGLASLSSAVSLKAPLTALPKKEIEYLWSIRKKIGLKLL